LKFYFFGRNRTWHMKHVWNKFCGFIHYNVKDMVLIMAHITLISNQCQNKCNMCHIDKQPYILHLYILKLVFFCFVYDHTLTLPNHGFPLTNFWYHWKAFVEWCTQHWSFHNFWTKGAKVTKFIVILIIEN
jgi:hypothetical protein